MSELTQDKAQELLDCVKSLMEKMAAQPPAPAAVDPNENPMQRLMAGPAKQEIMTLLKLVTWNVMQKLLPMMQGEGKPIDPALLALDKAKVEVQGATAIYRLKPGRLTTHWIEERGQYKLNDFSFKVSWLWVLLNWRRIRELRKQMQARRQLTLTSSS
jgi:hypothetical protein